MCFSKQIFLESEFASRLVWQEAPGQRPATSWEGSGAEEAFNDALTGGRETDFKPPEHVETLVVTGHIDPGLPVAGVSRLQDKFPQMKEIIDRLETIEAAEFWNKNVAALAGADLDQMRAVLKEIKEATLFKAVVENWTKKTLYEEFEDIMGDLYTQCASRPWLSEGWGQLTRLGHALIASENLGDGKNSYILEGPGKRNISPIERGKIMIPLIALERKIKKEILEPDWTTDPKINKDQLEFVEKKVIPQYRVFVIDKAILYNASNIDSDGDKIPDVIKNDYDGILRGLYKSCIKTK
ncbi:MAG: hypothetical protein AAB588_00740 [Patescibacteria group bacterium]